MASATRVIRGQPPSPPESTDQNTVADANQDFHGILSPNFGQPEPFSAADLHASHVPSEVKYEAASFLQDYLSPPSSQFVSNDYPRNISLHHPIDTPPSTADDCHVPGSLSSAPQWSSPQSQRQPPRPRVARPPRMRRKGRKLKDRESRPHVDKPLSELTKHLTHIPIKDMESWVHRSIETRRQEVAKKNGKIARPMNSFMLYRSAFAERAKEWFSQNNHQVVSEAAGDSWKLEPAEIRGKYEHLATVEKANHLKAHPGYKFSPAKDKKKRAGVDDDGNLANTPDSSPALLQSHGMSSSEVESSGWGSRDSTPFDFAEHGLPTESIFVSSSPWHASRGSMPGYMPSSDPSPYLLHSAHPGYMSHHDDFRFKRPSFQDISYNSSASLAGLPGASHHDLLQPASSASTPGSGQLDPQLLTLPNELPGANQMYSVHQPLWPDASTVNGYVPMTTSMPPSSVAYQAGSAYSSAPDIQHLEGRDTWDSPNDAKLEGSGGDLNSWMSY
ncbi:HMG-box domain-containing protein [Aspergillus aculeatinus CBS 121060]|uniref:HMG box protein n=1 Tax=Aspergillus aculeatinus CBS 121060 TaxID=1448322 RepID=A0ACD1HF19_9EURO|nr:HMG box protein [Aspergillus aculeatinus CBS 121060]RAH72075.1 HMG box protein [Aspergillus aculeatinus CBS 121060]